MARDTLTRQISTSLGRLSSQWNRWFDALRRVPKKQIVGDIWSPERWFLAFCLLSSWSCSDVDGSNVSWEARVVAATLLHSRSPHPWEVTGSLRCGSSITTSWNNRNVPHDWAVARTMSLVRNTSSWACWSSCWFSFLLKKSRRLE